MSLHKTLLAKLEIAQRFTKEHQSDVKKWISDYYAETPKAQTIEEIIERDQRYQYTAKVIFDNVEKYRSSFFEKPPEVMYSKKGKSDEEKAKKITATWEYLKDITNFKQFMDETFTYFGLCGFVSGHVGYRKQIETTVGEDGIEYTKYLYDDPILEVYDHENEWFMPDSEYSSDAREVSYFRKKKMTKTQVKDTFDKDIEADESILSEDIENEKENIKGELMRCGIYYYAGRLSKRDLFEYAQEQSEEPIEVDEEEVTDSEDDSFYYVVFTKKEVLDIYKSPIGEPSCALGRWFALPKKFFGFGLGRQLEEEQRQESIRTGQLVRYADLLAFPKLAIDLKDSGTDPKQLMQRNNPVITYKDKMPAYLSPPSSNGAIAAMQGQNQSNIQTNSGLMDVSKMQQTNTLNTATGQTAIQDSNEKRVKVAKEKYFEFLKQIIIKTFKTAQVEWQESKVKTITDEDGNPEDIELSKEDFADINFDTDITIDFENMNINKDVIRQQAIVMYDKVKEDPLVDRAKVFKKMLRDGFDEKNPDQYIKQSSVQEGMRFQGEDGQMYIADESGTVVLEKDLAQTMPESADDMQPASDQSAVQANPMVQAHDTKI